MLTVKHQEDNGRESVYSAVSTHFEPATDDQFAMLFVHRRVNGDDDAQISSGLVYVMNDSGKTVAVYGQGGRHHNWAPLLGVP